MATRFYFPASAPQATFTPSPDAGWNYTTEFARHDLARTKGTSAITQGVQLGPWANTAGQRALDRQWISPPLAAQTISGTFSSALMVREYATSDNVDQVVTSIRVVASDGTTVRGTLKAIGSSGTTLELISNVSHRCHNVANAAAISSLAVQDGDRLVIEIGYANSTAATTPEASAKWGENAADLPANNNAQTTNGAGWIEFSANLTFAVAIAGSSDGASATSGDVTRDRAIAGSSAGSSTDEGDVTLVPAASDVAIEGTSSGGSATSGALAADRALAATSTGGATTTGNAGRARDLAGSSAGSSGTSGTASVDRAVGGSSAGSASTVGEIGRDRSIAAISSASAGTTGTLATDRDLAGASAGTSSTTGAAAADRSLAGTSAATSATSATATREREIAASSEGSAGTSGAIQVDRALSGTSHGGSAASGTLTSGEPVDVLIGGTSDGSSATAGAIAADRAIGGASAGAGGASGTIVVDRALGGTSAAGSSTSGSLDGADPDTGTIEITSRPCARIGLRVSRRADIEIVARPRARIDVVAAPRATITITKDRAMYEVDDDAVLSLTFQRSSDGALRDPATLRAEVTPPGGVKAIHPYPGAGWTRIEEGTYTFAVDLNLPSWWLVRIVSTGEVKGAKTYPLLANQPAAP
jgi:hypothetical protein